jgi:hypothetical protein
MPGHPIAIKGSALDTNIFGDFDIVSELKETGNVYYNDVVDSEFDCPLAGDEFNPLAENVYGVANPYADPSRGTIDRVSVLAADADADGTFTWTQSAFLQNLSGKDSIIGKAIRLTFQPLAEAMAPPEAMFSVCCVIGQDSYDNVIPNADATADPAL